MRDRRNTFEVGEGLLYKGEEERIEQEEQYPEKRYNRQIKKFPTEKQNVSLKHILT
jgi:hypothetical protein